MKRSIVTVLALGLLVSAACASKQKTEDTGTATAAAAAPQVPTCAGHVVVVETPVVASGSYQADAVQRAVLQGMKSGGCTALPRPPSALPEGADLLIVSVRITSTGGGTGKVSAIVTQQASGQILGRFQESVSGAPEPSSRTLGEKIAGTLGS